MCLISVSLAYLQHKLFRNPDIPPMDKSKADCMLIQRPFMTPIITQNLQVIQKKCYLEPPQTSKSFTDSSSDFSPAPIF